MRDDTIKDLRNTISELRLLIDVAGVTLQTFVNLIPNNSFQLTANVLPITALNQNVTWYSSDPNIASVNDEGLVTSVAVGTATITATTQDGNFEATSTINVLSAQGCNTNEPGWGASGLGTITWGNTSNTDINYGTSTVYSNDPGRPTQIWSGAVFATACAKGGATAGEFAGGGTGNFNADCRQTYHTFNAGRDNGITGDFFSWCAVMRFADVLCPYPWRVPTTEDFRILHQNLGFNLPSTGSAVNHNNGGHFMPTDGTAQSPQIGGIWGGARFAGVADGLITTSTDYWSSTEVDTNTARNLSFSQSRVFPQDRNNKRRGFPLRCVRDVP